jgi:hypothetical protein
LTHAVEGIILKPLILFSHIPPSYSKLMSGFERVWWCMNLRKEVLAYTRACEHLLSLGGTLTDDERGLLDYYLKELSRKFLSDGSTVPVPSSETVGAMPTSAA